MPTLSDLIYQMQENERRQDNTKKGQGYFGPLLDDNGKVSTELSFDFDWGGKNYFAPLLVPTLSKRDIDYLLSGGKPTQDIYEKAAQHALERLRIGKPVFATPMDIFRLPK